MFSQFFTAKAEKKNSVVFAPHGPLHIDGSETDGEIATGIYISNAVLDRLGNPSIVKITINTEE